MRGGGENLRPFLVYALDLRPSSFSTSVTSDTSVTFG